MAKLLWPRVHTAGRSSSKLSIMAGHVAMDGPTPSIETALAVPQPRGCRDPGVADEDEGQEPHDFLLLLIASAAGMATTHSLRLTGTPWNRAFGKVVRQTADLQTATAWPGPLQRSFVGP